MLSGESEDKKESDASEEKKDEAKDSFDKMLDGESEEKKEEPKDSFDKVLDGEPEEKKSTDESEEKKDSAEPATTIDADALDETVEKMDEPEKMDTDEPKVVEIISDKVPSDEKYYENLNAEEKEFLENDENLPTVDSICTKLVCSVCSKNLEPVFGLPKSVYRHPHLGIPVCRDCREFYGDGDWASSEDGDEYCRMCGQGGDILLCDKCPNAFRRQCLQRSLGSRALREIQKAEEWNCLVCDPKPLYNLKAIYYCVYKKQEEFKNRREENIKKEKERQAARKARASAPTNKEKEDLVKSPKNFLGTLYFSFFAKIIPFLMTRIPRVSRTKKSRRVSRKTRSNFISFERHVFFSNVFHLLFWVNYFTTAMTISLDLMVSRSTALNSESFHYRGEHQRSI